MQEEFTTVAGRHRRFGSLAVGRVDKSARLNTMVRTILRYLVATPLGNVVYVKRVRKIPLTVRILMEIDKLAAHGRRHGQIVQVKANEDTTGPPGHSLQRCVDCGSTDVGRRCLPDNQDIPETDHVINRLTLLLQISAMVIMVEEDLPTFYSPSETWSRTRQSILLVRDYVLEFSCDPSYNMPNPGDTLKPALSSLIYALLEREFLFAHTPVRFPSSVYPNPLLDTLRSHQFYDSSPQTTSHSITMAILHTLLVVGDDPTQTLEHSRASLLPALAMQLYWSWSNEQDERRQLNTVSMMPWSALTIQEGLPSLSEPILSSLHSRTPFADLGSPQSISAVRSRLWSEFICFPAMWWLGARHDGYPVSPSLSTYVWRRYRPEMTRREHLALWQSALSFGLLEAILDLPIPERFLLSHQTDGSTVLTSHNMSILCIELIRVLKSAQKHVRAVRARSAKDVITRAFLALDEAALPWKNARGIFRGTGLTKDEETDMVCSLATLSTGLYIAIHGICRKELIWTRVDPNDVRLDGLPRRSEVSRGVAGYVYQCKMIEAGWCPFAVRGLVHDSPALSLLAFACARKPFIRRTQDEHTGCTSARCTVHDIDPAQYTTQHARSPCSCGFLYPPFTPISEHLLRDEIPILTYDGRRLSVHRAGDVPYVAISHVWADGLGSTTQEGLPTCQVVRISSAARKLVPGGAFWVDSLCVPGKVDLRKKAIRLMSQTYQLAAKVLVFDAGIRSLCSVSQSMDENYLRIMTSTWAQRVWTLQEALLSRELLFEFSDRPVASWELFLPRSHGVLNIFSPVRNDFLMSSGLQLLHHDPSESWSSARYTFDQISGLLMRRTTSKPEDETVAVAGLLGVDVARLLHETGQDARMRVFLLEVRTVPAAIMLADAPARLPFPGFRWAPRSFSGIEEEFIRNAGFATCTQDGLTTERELTIISFPRITASKSVTSSPNRIFVHLPLSGSLYALPNLRKLAGEGVHAIDAVIIFTQTPETPLIAKQPVVVVSITHSASDDVPGEKEEEPLKCIYRFRGYLGNWSDRFRPSEMLPELFEALPDDVFFAATRFSRRVLIT